MLFEHVLIKIYFLTKVPWRDKKSRGGTNQVPGVPSQENAQAHAIAFLIIRIEIHIHILNSIVYQDVLKSCYKQLL